MMKLMKNPFDLLQFTCSSADLRSCIGSGLNVSVDSVNPCHAVSLNYSLDPRHTPCGEGALVCNFPEVNLRTTELADTGKTAFHRFAFYRQNCVDAASKNHMCGFQQIENNSLTFGVQLKVFLEHIF